MRLDEKELKRVKENLCDYDKRNPDYDEEYEKKEGVCFCDCCFYGRAWLAELILKLIGEDNEKDRSVENRGRQNI